MRPAYITYVLKQGKYFGQTLTMIAKKDPGYIEWLAGLAPSTKGFKKEAVQAARAYIASPEWQRICPLVSCPAEVYADRRLPLGARHLFGAIFNADQQADGGCRLSNEAICDVAGLTLKCVKDNLRVLEREGLIARTVEGGRRPKITVLWRPDRPAREGKRVPPDGDTAVPPRPGPPSPPRIRLRGGIEARGEAPDLERPRNTTVPTGPLMEVLLRNGLSRGPFGGAHQSPDDD